MKYAKLLYLVVGVALIGLLSPSVLAVENSGVGGKPANPRPDNKRTESIFVHELQPGQSVRDAVRVINNTSEPKTVEVYATDAQVSSGGAFACEQKADALDKEGTWIKLDKTSVDLGPNGSEDVGFTISVPSNAGVGERNACIAMQAVQSPTTGTTGGVQLSFRSAIRVAVTIPGEFVKDLRFEKLETFIEENKLTVRQTLFNGGNVSLDTTLDTKLQSVFGNTIDAKKGDYPMLSGQTAEFNFDFKRPNWGGFYRISAEASYNSDVDQSLGETGGEIKTISSSKTIFVAPKPAYFLLYAVVLLGGGLLVFLYKRSRSRLLKLREAAITHQVSKNEDVTTIANNYHSDWKQIVKINNLKAPYTLHAKDEILVVPGADYVPPAKDKPPKQKKKTTATKKETPTKKVTSKKSASSSKKADNNEQSKG